MQPPPVYWLSTSSTQIIGTPALVSGWLAQLPKEIRSAIACRSEYFNKRPVYLEAANRRRSHRLPERQRRKTSLVIWLTHTHTHRQVVAALGLYSWFQLHARSSWTSFARLLPVCNF